MGHKKLYEKEISVAKEAVEMINKRFSVSLAEEKMGFIA